MPLYVWSCAPICYLEFLDKLQKWRYRTVGPSLAASPEPMTHRWNEASLSLFYKYYFGRCTLELAQLVPLPFSWGRSSCYSNRLHDFSVTIPRCYKDVYVNSFLHCPARPWNLVPIECFCLTYNLNGLKSIINIHVLTVGSFQREFPVWFNLFFLLILVTKNCPKALKLKTWKLKFSNNVKWTKIVLYLE